ncbi:hypothetical protein GW17_00034794, partial [Ensete ventricosum]
MAAACASVANARPVRPPARGCATANCWRSRLPLALPLLHVTASACGHRLMRLPSSLDRLAVDNVTDAADLYAHSVLPQADPAKN